MDLDDAELATQLRETLHRAAEPVHGEGLFKETIRNEVARRQAARSRARWTGRLVLAGAAVAAAAALFVLVKPDQDRVDTDGTAPPATQPETPTTVAPDRSGTATTETPDTTSPTTEATAESSTTTSPTAPSLPDFPPAVTTGLTHGQMYWGLYLAIAPAGEYQSPALLAADAARAEAGYPSGGGFGSLSCDQGAAEALGADPASLASSLYFETEAEVDQARAAFEARGRQVVGVAQVTTYCLD